MNMIFSADLTPPGRGESESPTYPAFTRSGIAQADQHLRKPWLAQMSRPRDGSLPAQMRLSCF
jgi:hypothetical protein